MRMARDASNRNDCAEMNAESPIRALFAIKSLNVQGGGAERVLVAVCNGLVSRGHDVQILTFDTRAEGFYTLDSRIRRLDIGIGEPGQPTPRTGFLRAIPHIRRLVRSAKPDLVVAFMHSTYVPLALALVGTGAIIVASEHVDARHFRTRRMQELLVRLAEQLTVAKTVPSAPLREEHATAYRQRVHVIPNPVDIEAFSPIANIGESCPHLVTSIGRLMYEKGHIDLIRAFAELAGDFPDWCLRIVGDGVLRAKLEKEVVKLGLEDRVQMPGYARDVIAEYAAANIIALPSLYESFGMVAAEALASGRPVVAFRDCLGIAEMIESGKNGLLIESKPDRIRNLADGLERLMSDSTLRARLAAAGPDSVRPFALKSVVDTWEQFLLDLVRKSA